MATTEKPALLAAGVYGQFVTVDYILWVTTQSAIKTAQANVRRLERALMEKQGTDEAAVDT